MVCMSKKLLGNYVMWFKYVSRMHPRGLVETGRRLLVDLFKMLNYLK
jgi:hypothetical protein